jgi:molybdopterin/thiamine biosynthesis adenylyltransferase
MSSTVLDRNPDLKRLRDEGYDVSVKQGYLFVSDVPLVNEQREIRRAVLVSSLNLAGETVEKPETHVVMLIGEYPCDEHGQRLAQLEHGGPQDLGGGIKVDFSFSNKPTDGYPDYYAKMTSYTNIIQGPAQALDSDLTAKTFPAFVPDEDDDTVFKYIDTGTSRANIGAINEKLELEKVAIIGLGGTGSYVLDFIAKVPIREIHLFDADTFSSHNAFRSPGAASLDQLNSRPSKVAYFKEQYDRMRHGIVAHETAMTEGTVDQLEDMAFVFLCVDEAATKRPIVDALERFGIPFVDVGMGVEVTDQALGGIVRTTLSTPERREHFRCRVSLADREDDGDYDTNIQIAELNALNAAIAVMKLKKHFGFYRDYAGALNALFTIDTDQLLSEDAADEA